MNQVSSKWRWGPGASGVVGMAFFVEFLYSYQVPYGRVMRVVLYVLRTWIEYVLEYLSTWFYSYASCYAMLHDMVFTYPVESTTVRSTTKVLTIT